VTAAVAVGETCRSAQSSFVCETAPLPAAAQPEPPGGGEPFDVCYACRVTGGLRGTLKLCGYSDEVIVDPWDEISPARPEPVPIIFRSMAFFETAKGTLIAVERGVELESPRFPAAQYWASLMEPVGGTGYFDGATGLIILHNLWNQSYKATSIGEICMP
jgi:hypothetical protein